MHCPKEFTYWCWRVSKGKLIYSHLYVCIYSSPWKRECGHKHEASHESDHVSFNAHHSVIAYLLLASLKSHYTSKKLCAANYSYCSANIVFALAKRTAQREDEGSEDCGFEPSSSLWALLQFLSKSTGAYSLLCLYPCGKRKTSMCVHACMYAYECLSVREYVWVEKTLLDRADELGPAEKKPSSDSSYQYRASF